MDEPPGKRLHALRQLLAPTRDLDPQQVTQVERERVAVNQARLRAVTPALAVIMAAAGLVTLIVPSHHPDGARWLRGVLYIDLGAALASVAMYLAARARAEHGVLGWLRPRLGDVFTVVAIATGVALTINTLQYQFRISAWLVAIMAPAVLVHPRSRVLIGAHLIGTAAVAMACFEGYPDPETRTGQLSAVFAFVLMLLAFARVTFAGFVATAVARSQLARVNLELESRVAVQVGEILDNTRRIEALNRALAGQVKARSDELAAALRRLAMVEHGDETLGPGTALGDRFEIRHVLGVGGMGVVYAAYDRLTETPVALKVLRTQVHDTEHGYRFLQEAGAAASLSHPAIVKVLHVDVTAEGRLYQALELIDGQPLDTWLSRNGALEPGVVARLGAVVADALADAHAHGVIHRDVKPQNIMITLEPPGCCLLDFGLARLREHLNAPELSAQGTVIGTPQFLAPEQVSHPADITGAADVYSLGVVLYWCASGRLPFSATTPVQWLYAHVHDPPAPPPDSVPAPLADLIMRCLDKDQAQRPDAAALSTELSGFADRVDAPPLAAWATSASRHDTRPLVAPAS